MDCSNMVDLNIRCDAISDTSKEHSEALYPQYSSEYFPRCEYRSRFEKTSAFMMTQPEFWGTYFRSTAPGGNCDRLSKLPIKRKRKTYENTILNQPNTPASKSGAFNSPWTYQTYKDIFRKDIAKIGNFDTNFECIYDIILNYKMSICNEVIRQFKKQNVEQIKIGVFCRNEYPCIMVKIYDFDNIRGESSSFYSLSLAYFTALTNYVSQQKGIPVELVQRSSFGHNVPSVAEVDSCFRINMGIVPMIYADSLVESLIIFNNKFVIPFLGKNLLSLQFSAEEIATLNDNIDKYNRGKKMKEKTKKAQEVQRWNINENLFDILSKVGDSGGHKVSYQLTRINKYMDFLTDCVFDELQKNNYSADFGKPLRDMLRKLHYNGENLVVILDIQDSLYGKTQLQFSENEHLDIAEDEEFWNILTLILDNTAFNHSNIGSTHDSLSHAVMSRKLLGVFDSLDRLNIDFITNCSYQHAEDDHGSDSDCEIENDNGTLFSKKIILNTGMRAINAALFLSRYITKCSNIAKEIKKFMYYETDNAMKHVCNILEGEVCKETIKVIIDLNHCSKSESDPEIDLNNIYDNISTEELVAVFDYTSATTKKIRLTVEKFIVKVPVIILLNSGLKNEQFGADMNPYGTIRIITKDRKKLDELYLILICALGYEIAPKELHLIRKAYKDAGTVVTNRLIFNDEHMVYTNRQKADVFSKYDKEIYKEKFMKIAEIFQNDKLRDMLIPLYYVGLQGVFGAMCDDKYFTENDLLRFKFSIEKLCDLVKENNWKEEVNELSLELLKTLLELLYKGNEYALVNLILLYDNTLEDILTWNCEKIEFLGSEKIKEIIQIEGDYGYFELILNYYEADNEILEIVLSDFDPFEPHHDLMNDFENLKGIKDDSDDISYTDLEDNLEIIREQRLRDGYFEENDEISDNDLEIIHEQRMRDQLTDEYLEQMDSQDCDGY